MSSSTNNNSLSQQENHSNTNSIIPPIIRSTIDDFREIVREQTNLPSTSSSDISIKKYSPIPSIFPSETYVTSSKPIQSNKQIYNHFASSQRTQLPSLNSNNNNKRSILPTMLNVMDLHEDLPQCNINTTHRAATYTSPGDRIISPIKRPSAPSPPTSAQIRRFDQINHEDNQQNYLGLTDEDSQLFNDNFYHYHQPIIMKQHRIDHYNCHGQIVERHPTIIINDGHDELAHPLDSYDFES